MRNVNTVSLQPELWTKIDREAEKQHLDRSKLIAIMAYDYFKKKSLRNYVDLAIFFLILGMYALILVVLL